MDFRHLRYFVAVAEEGNFTRAALRVHVAQPALSKQIHDLEEEIGAPLLLRTPRGVALTPTGRELLGHARGLLASEARARESVRGLGSGTRVLRVGLPETASARLALRAAARAFRAAHPECVLELAAIPAGDQPRAVAAGELDVGWHLAAPDEPGVEGEPWATLEVDHVALPEEHPAAAAPAVALRALAGTPLHGPRGMPGGDVAARLRSAGWTGEVLATWDLPVALLCISVGEGWCLLPGGGGAVLPAGVAVRPLAEGVLHRLEVHLLHRAGEADPALRELVALLLQCRDAAAAAADPGTRAPAGEDAEVEERDPPRPSAAAEADGAADRRTGGAGTRRHHRAGHGSECITPGRPRHPAGRAGGLARVHHDAVRPRPPPPRDERQARGPAAASPPPARPLPDRGGLLHDPPHLRDVPVPGRATRSNTPRARGPRLGPAIATGGTVDTEDRMTPAGPLTARAPSVRAGTHAELRRGPVHRWRYGVAVAATALALLGAFALRPLHVHTNLLFVAAVSVTAWYGGRGPGLAASVLAMAAIAVGPANPSLAEPGIGEAVYLLAFLFVALVVGATTESLRRAQLQAEMRAGELERLTAALAEQMHEVQTLSEHLQESNESLSAALAAAEDMASHATRLQEVTAALSQASTECEVADVVLGRGLAAVQSTRGVLARVDGGRLVVIRASGFEPDAEARLLALPPGDDTPLARAARTGEPVWHRSADGGAVPLRHSAEVVGALAIGFAEPSGRSDANRAFSLLLAQAAADALVRARSYDAERVARRGAEMLARARADVLGIVAHDLRNPLNVVSSSGGFLLESGDLSPVQRRMLEMTQRAVRQMNRLIGDLLDATRLEAGRLTLDLAQVDARVVVDEAEETCRATAEEHRVELRSWVPDHPCPVRADGGRLLQVLGNLVGNALKFTPAGGTVVLSARAAGAEVVFSVADSGPGIPPEDREHLFDSFWQARDGDRRGVGLGLAITRGIVEAHGGRIWVESTVGAGSTFWFALPAGGAAPTDRPRTLDLANITIAGQRPAA